MVSVQPSHTAMLRQRPSSARCAGASWRAETRSRSPRASPPNAGAPCAGPRAPPARRCYRGVLEERPAALAAERVVCVRQQLRLEMESAIVAPLDEPRAVAAAAAVDGASISRSLAQLEASSQRSHTMASSIVPPSSTARFLRKWCCVTPKLYRASPRRARGVLERLLPQQLLRGYRLQHRADLRLVARHVPARRSGRARST